MDNRPICVRCNLNPRAINYKKDDKVYYRTLCDPCNGLQKKEGIPRWIKENYKKKAKCEACGFVPKYPEQLTVYDYKDSFKTICMNCDTAAKIAKRLEVKKGDLKPDF